MVPKPIRALSDTRSEVKGSIFVKPQIMHLFHPHLMNFFSSHLIVFVRNTFLQNWIFFDIFESYLLNPLDIFIWNQ